MKRDARVYDIDWDTDGETVALPKHVLVWIEHDDAAAFNDEDQINALIGDILTNEHVWCVNEFKWEWVDSPCDGRGWCTPSSRDEGGPP